MDVPRALARERERGAVVADLSYTRVRELGRGADGIVDLVTTADGRSYVMKTAAAGKEQNLAREAAALAEIRGLPGFAQLVGFTPGGAMVLELARGMTLTNFYWHLHRMGDFDHERHIAAISSQLAAHLDTLHARGIAHNDLHDGNVLYDSETSTLTILDFGRSQPVGREIRYNGLLMEVMPRASLAARAEYDRVPLTAAEGDYLYALTIVAECAGDFKGVPYAVAHMEHVAVLPRGARLAKLRETLRRDAAAHHAEALAWAQEH